MVINEEGSAVGSIDGGDMGTVGWECACSCHDVEQIEGFRANHPMPCCVQCPYCGANVRIGAMEIHIRDQHPSSCAGQPEG